MAFEDFWRNVRRAARLIRSEGVVADSQRFPSEEIAKHLATGAFWLTPGAVGDYDEADFAFLERDEVAQLSKSVLRFRQLAQTVNPRGPVTREQLAEAIPLFQVIIERLEFERFADSEAFRLGHQIEARVRENGRPEELVELRFQTGDDHSGEPAIWMWAFLEDTVTEDNERYQSVAESIGELLSRVSREVAPELFPFIAYRSVSEQTLEVARA